MSLSSHNSPAPVRRPIPIALLLFCLLLPGIRAMSAVHQAPRERAESTRILDLLYRQKYNEAITRLERVLERNPVDADALTYMATANLYLELNFLKSMKEFDTAFKAGGGATLFVTHSHERFSTGDVVDYCRGWLHLRSDALEFVPIDGNHGFKSRYQEVEELKTNRLSKKVFHIRVGEKNQNFRGRSNSEGEPLLIIALYKSFARK